MAHLSGIVIERTAHNLALNFIHLLSKICQVFSKRVCGLGVTAYALSLSAFVSKIIVSNFITSSSVERSRHLHEQELQSWTKVIGTRHAHVHVYAKIYI